MADFNAPLSLVENAILKNKLVTENQLKMARHTSILKDTGIPEAISLLGFSNEADILRVIAVEMGYKAENVLGKLPKINVEILENFPNNLANGVATTREQCLFDYDAENKIAKILVADPLDTVPKDKTEQFYLKCGITPEFYVTTKLNLALCQKAVYHSGKNYENDIFNTLTAKDDAGEGIDAILSMIFEYAALERTSDIYFNYNRYNDDLSYVFFRIDRKKAFKFALPEAFATRIIQTIKQRSGMEGGRIRGHQDGSFEIAILDKKYNLSVRVSSITTVSGEQVTMRIQMEDREQLEGLGFAPDIIAKIRTGIQSLKGIVVLAGVTGSGKTTTLYSMLSELDPDAYNILTMEDPVEIRVKGLNQVEINDKAGQSFAETIRSALRQAPDVVLLGEVRDVETASRAVEMALTGHLVLTTIHTDSVSAIRERLRDLGVENVESFIDSMTIAIHQELVAKKGGGLRMKYEASFDGLKTVERSN